MTAFRAAAVVGFVTAAAIAVVASASALAMGWQQASLACLPCIADALYNQYGIPGAVFGAAAAVVATIGVGGFPTYGGVGFGGGVVASPGFRDAFGRRDGDDVTTYIPGVTPVPDKGDLIYIPGVGSSRVTDVYYDPNSYGPDGNPGGVVVVTELGSVTVGIIPSEH